MSRYEWLAHGFSCCWHLYLAQILPGITLHPVQMVYKNGKSIWSWLSTREKYSLGLPPRKMTTAYSQIKLFSFAAWFLHPSQSSVQKKNVELQGWSWNSRSRPTHTGGCHTHPKDKLTNTLDHSKLLHMFSGDGKGSGQGLGTDPGPMPFGGPIWLG